MKSGEDFVVAVKFCKFICVIIAIVFAPWTPLSAQSANGFKTCSVYEEFLKDEQSFYQSSGCDKNTAFLLDNAQLDHARFVLAYNKITTRNSAMNILTTGLKHVIFGSPENTYKFLELADVLIYEEFHQYGDKERELVYTYLISEIKKQALFALFEDRAKIEKLFGKMPEKTIEARPYLTFMRNEVVQKRPDIALMCLLSSDNLVVPLGEVTNSPRFLGCLK